MALSGCTTSISPKADCIIYPLHPVIGLSRALESKTQNRKSVIHHANAHLNRHSAIQVVWKVLSRKYRHKELQ